MMTVITYTTKLKVLTYNFKELYLIPRGLERSLVSENVPCPFWASGHLSADQEAFDSFIEIE